MLTRSSSPRLRPYYRSFCLLLVSLFGAASSSGQTLQWEKTLHSTPPLTPAEFVKEAVATPQGTVLVSMAATGNVSTLRSHFWLLDAATGDSIWQRPGLPQHSGEQALRLLPNGNFGFLTEERALTSGDAVALYMQQFTPSGTVPSRFRFPLATPAYGAEFGVGLLAVPGATGGYILASMRGGRERVHLVSVTDQGALRWVRNYGWSTNEGFCDVQLDAAGRAVVYSLYAPYVPNARNALKLLQLDPVTGDSLRGVSVTPARTRAAPAWNATNTLNQLLPLSDGGLVLCTAIDTVGGPFGRYTMSVAMKVDAQLRPVWTHLQGATAALAYPHYVNGVALQDGSVLLLADGSQARAYELHHLDGATGRLLGAYTYTSQACPRFVAASLAPGADGRTVYVTGTCLGAATNGAGAGGYVARLLLPAALPGVVTAARPAALPTPALALYPNPAADQATVQLPAALPRPVRVELRDALGRAVRAYPLPAGHRELTLPLAGLPAGPYWLRLTDADGHSAGPARQLLVLP